VTFLEALHVAPDALTRHAVALMVVGPLIGACAAALAPGPRWAWVVATWSAAFAVWMALAVAGEVARDGVVSYVLGGFAAPWGIEFRVDALGAMFAFLVAAMGLAAALYSGHSLEAEVMAPKRPLFQAGFLLCLAGLLGMTATGDAFNAFVFLEVSSIGTYALVAIGAHRDRRALPAAFQYLIMGTIGAMLFVIGVGYLYGVTGTLNIVDMTARLQGMEDRPAVQAGFALIVVGLGLKAAMFPMHGWLPAAYAYGPSLMGVFLSATATKAAIYLLCRFLFGAFSFEQVLVQQFLTYFLAPAAALAAIICSLQAMFQSELRRMLAFSSVAQVGLIMLGVATASTAAVSAAFLHLIAHALMKAAMFMAIGGLALRVRACDLADFAGAGRAAPLTMLAFSIAALSLAGIPFTLGFLSKWMLIEAWWQDGAYLYLGVMALASLLSFLYVGRMLETLYFRTPPTGAETVSEAPLGALLPMWALTLATLWFGVAGGPLLEVTGAAAGLLVAAP
jgi:multicomponent Na+:H+ antiporter subunit D